MFLLFQWLSGSFFLTLFLPQLSNYQKGITVRGWGDSIEPEDNANTCSSSAPLVSKINQGSIPKWLV